MAVSVSCLIPMFNAAPFVDSCIASVLSQGCRDAEIVVVDDGSTDGSRAIVERYTPQIRLIVQPHGGVSAARNRALAESTGDFVAFQDADDLWPPGRLRAMVDALAVDDEAEAVVGRVEIVDLRRNARSRRESRATAHRIVSLGSLVLRRSVFDKVGVFNEQLPTGEDMEFAMRTRMAGVVYRLLDMTSLIYRLHDAGTSTSTDSVQADLLEVMHNLGKLRRKQ